MQTTVTGGTLGFKAKLLKYFRSLLNELVKGRGVDSFVMVRRYLMFKILFNPGSKCIQMKFQSMCFAECDALGAKIARLIRYRLPFL